MKCFPFNFKQVKKKNKVVFDENLVMDFFLPTFIFKHRLFIFEITITGLLFY